MTLIFVEPEPPATGTYLADVEKLHTGGYTSRMLAIPDCTAEAATHQGAADAIREAARLWFERAATEKRPLPPPDFDRDTNAVEEAAARHAVQRTGQLRIASGLPHLHSYRATATQTFATDWRIEIEALPSLTATAVTLEAAILAMKQAVTARITALIDCKQPVPGADDVGLLIPTTVGWQNTWTPSHNPELVTLTVLKNRLRLLYSDASVAWLDCHGLTHTIPSLPGQERDGDIGGFFAHWYPSRRDPGAVCMPEAGAAFYPAACLPIPGRRSP